MELTHQPSAGEKPAPREAVEAGQVPWRPGRCRGARAGAVEAGQVPWRPRHPVSMWLSRLPRPQTTSLPSQPLGASEHSGFVPEQEHTVLPTFWPRTLLDTRLTRRHIPEGHAAPEAGQGRPTTAGADFLVKTV